MTNAYSGQVITTAHQHIEVASGLNYPDSSTGRYLPSADLFELTATNGGAAAVHGPTKLYVKPNLNSAGVITMISSSNRVTKTKPIGIFWYNAQSGQAVLAAPIQDCVAQLVLPNTLIWKSAFGAVADLRLVYTKSAIESDLWSADNAPGRMGC